MDILISALNHREFLLGEIKIGDSFFEICSRKRGVTSSSNHTLEKCADEKMKSVENEMYEHKRETLDN